MSNETNVTHSCDQEKLPLSTPCCCSSLSDEGPYDLHIYDWHRDILFIFNGESYFTWVKAGNLKDFKPSFQVVKVQGRKELISVIYNYGDRVEFRNDDCVFESYTGRSPHPVRIEKPEFKPITPYIRTLYSLAPS